MSWCLLVSLGIASVNDSQSMSQLFSEDNSPLTRILGFLELGLFTLMPVSPPECSSPWLLENVPEGEQYVCQAESCSSCQN